jgi:hypothetical protein
VTAPLTTPGAVGRATARATAQLFRGLSHLRGERAIHARGHTRTGRLTVTGRPDGPVLLTTPAAYDVVVRTSRSLGLPQPLPDVLGLAVRVLDCYGPGAHQDLLLDTGAAPPLLRRLPLPRLDPGAHRSSLAPYAAAGRRVLLGARPDGDAWELLVAGAHDPWEVWGRVELGPELPAPEGRRLRFDPWVTGDDLRPVGLVNALRRGAYPASHVGPDA